MKLLQIKDTDNVAVALEPLKCNEKIYIDSKEIVLKEDIKEGHKVAIKDINQGEDIVKYGFPIGQALIKIKKGSWVHEHNIKTKLGDLLEYKYEPQLENGDNHKVFKNKTFKGYKREDGRVGVRNEIWIIPTVGCVNRTAEVIAKKANEKLKNTSNNIDGIYELKHPYGCSQMGEDQLNTQKILANFVNHPNAAAVLVLGLGCENNNIDVFKTVLKDYDENRVKFLVAQDVDDEIEAGLAIIEELIEFANKYTRQDCSISDLSIGLKCGGSDGFSGLTANPLVGAFSDSLVGAGGTTVLTEVPEMFGAETILMNRCINEEVFDKTVSLINDFKNYFKFHDQPIYENPSPGNKAGGISTLEEKSLGCIQKGGTQNVVDVLQYGDKIKKNGLNLLNAPGNDMVASTALAAAGCQIVLFTTGRGTPLGTCVPTIKISTNNKLFNKKINWMDFDASPILEGHSMEAVLKEFWEYVIDIAEGKPTKSEELGFREITIFKTGVTL